MLNEIWVDNFRSLENYYLKIEPGLNVLVGPNGAGKTSIMKWFEFLSLLSHFTLRESIGKIGGANHVFRRFGGEYEDSLSFYFTGSTKIAERFGTTRRKKPLYANYRFRGKISILKNQIFFSEQDTEIWVSQSKDLNFGSNPNIELRWKYDIITDEIQCKINTNKKNLPRLNDMEKYFFSNCGILERQLREKDSVEHLIIGLRFFPVDFLYIVKEDISYKKAFNINPGSVRTALDISSQPGVQYDGAGLAATLYDLHANMAPAAASRYRVRSHSDYSTRLFQRVIDYFKLSDESIVTLHVDIDSFRNEFLLEVEYENADFGEGRPERYKVPVFLLSDGTVKWLAIVVAIVTEENSLFIEEPENFLHPRLQENIVEIIREEINLRERECFSLITTHSETLLNKLDPTEIVLTGMKNGRTESRRIEDPESISKIISESGFGLGYFYISGEF